MRRCSTCRAEKPIAGFPKNRSEVGGHSYECFDCKRSRPARTGRESYYAAWRQVPENARKERDRKLRQLYGITLDEYEAMLEEQDFACAICRRTPSYTLNVDHCHGTLRVRGLLCTPCNQMLGHVADDPDTLLRAVGYLSL